MTPLARNSNLSAILARNLNLDGRRHPFDFAWTKFSGKNRVFFRLKSEKHLIREASS
jgi:hypothetical protein